MENLTESQKALVVHALQKLDRELSLYDPEDPYKNLFTLELIEQVLNKLKGNEEMNEFDYSEYVCPFSHVEKACGHELHGPDGYEGVWGVWCACGFRGPVSYLDPEVLGLKKKPTKQNEPSLEQALQILVNACHGRAKKNGWWAGAKLKGDFPIKSMLVVTEIAEAVEADRKSLADDHLPHRPGREVELADAIIRIADMAGGFDLDLGGAVVEKLAYNDKRADHKPENRAKAGGKDY